MGERSSSVDGNWECLTEAVSPAVNTRRSELWRSSEPTCPSPNTSTPAQRGQPASARPYTVPHGSREVGAAPRRHCARLRASRSPPLSATPSTRDAGPPIISDVRPVMPWCRTTSAQDDRDGRSSVRRHGRGCALACRSGWAGHSWIRRAESRQLGWALAGGGKPASQWFAHRQIRKM